MNFLLRHTRTHGWLRFFIILVISTRIFTTLPIPYYGLFESLIIIAGMLFILIYYIHNLLNKPGKISSHFEIYLTILLFLPLYSAWRAEEVFSQPIVFGVLTQRAIWLIGTVILLWYWQRTNKITINDISVALRDYAWIFLMVYAFFYAVIDPTRFVAQYPMFVAPSAYGVIYKFDPLPIVYGYFYYFVKQLQNNKIKDLAYMAVFLLFLVIVSDKRSLILAIIVASGFVAWRCLPAKKLLILSIKAALTITLVIGLVYVTNQKYVLEKVSSFSNALSVVVSGEETDEASANARISETLLALPYIKRNWLLGNGDLSNQWQDGYEGKLGYFYPSDIGLIGGVFIYGVIGILICYLQFLFIFPSSKTVYVSENMYLTYFACQGVTFMLFAQSLIKGGIVFSPSVSLVFIAVLLGISKQAHNNYTHMGRI